MRSVIPLSQRKGVIANEIENRQPDSLEVIKRQVKLIERDFGKRVSKVVARESLKLYEACEKEVASA